MTAKEKLFCAHYLTLHCATQSALKAGYSESEAKKAHLLLRREDIKNHLRELEEDPPPLSLKKSAVRGLERLAFSSSADVLSVVNGTQEINDSDLFCVSEIKKSDKGAVEVMFYDRIKALQVLYEIGLAQDESLSVPFFEALRNAVPDNEDGI